MSLRLTVVGGFLGAGKTSAILKIADLLIKKGYKVGIVTNDQSENLVDTNFLRSEGLPVAEVVRGCFCCNFDEFTLKLRALAKTDMPDVILAEPVGSCTDLVATIFKPIMNDYTAEFVLSPLTVLADPRRVKNYMAALGSGVINEINYLFDKQLSEADIILLNKCDLLSDGEIENIASFLRRKYPGAEVLPVSALTGDGFVSWFDLALRRDAPSKPSSDIDYGIYAKAEAALGWYNGFATVRSQANGDSPQKVNINTYVETLLLRIKRACSEKKLEIAHLKAYAVTGLDHAKASVTSSEDSVTFNRRAEFESDSFNLILDARIEAEPAVLEQICENAVRQTAEQTGMTLQGYKADCFSPSYPTPKHRVP
jgi:G3E family GTPase